MPKKFFLWGESWWKKIKDEGFKEREKSLQKQLQWQCQNQSVPQQIFLFLSLI